MLIALASLTFKKSKNEMFYFRGSIIIHTLGNRKTEDINASLAAPANEPLSAT
jgi:hypothetical protein